MTRALRAAALLLLAALALPACSRAAGATTAAPVAAPAATVVYYYIPGCAVCARTTERLRAVVARYHDRVTLRLVDCTTPEGEAGVARYGFRSHGLALLDGQGAPQLLESDHRVFPEHVGEALTRILKTPRS